MKFKKVILIMVFLNLSPTKLYAIELVTFSAIENSVNTLICERVLKEAYRRINIDIVINQYPASRSLYLSEKGSTDGELFRIGGQNKKYPNLLQISVPINKLEAVAFTKNAQFTVNGWESLKPYKVGIQRGIRFAEKGTRSIKGLYTHVVNSNEQLFSLLEKDRVDVIVIAYLNGLETMQKLKIPGIKLLKPAIETYPLYHYLHKKNEHLQPEITASLQSMKEEGLIQKIRDQVINEQYGSENSP
ncbi:substrate-binding periplasmic protein [Shewanella frigidimarina]|uniref:substrate-binding periplasmic protein n=1 Tax=Shewanella frigidimarina TaxID=56812 RepID=UPI003D7A66D2